jgi:hypothetical protein
MNFAIDLGLPYPPRDELRDLGAEIEDEDHLGGAGGEHILLPEVVLKSFDFIAFLKVMSCVNNNSLLPVPFAPSNF